MPVSIVVGGQYGSEGKGKVAAWLSKERQADAVVRCGGTNSGHTVYSEFGEKYVFRQLPTASLQRGVVSVLVSGSYIDVDVLKREIELAGLTPELLFIDPHAVVITSQDKAYEARSGLIDRISSTGSGTGSALIRRISRDEKTLFAKDIDQLQPYLTDTKEYLSGLLFNGGRVVIEGTQGYGLSVLHSKHYPYVTSRDTTAAGFLSECGVSPLHVDEIVLVIRAFPIRVSGPSGPLAHEVTWEEVSREAGFEKECVEYTSVTNSVRRVARFDPGVVCGAIMANSPTHVILNHLDYVDPGSRDVFLSDVESSINHRVDYVGLGPEEICRLVGSRKSYVQNI